MKKILLSLAAVASMGLVACGGSDKATDTAADSATTVVEETVAVVEESVPTETVDATTAQGFLDQIKSSATSENVNKAINYVKQLISEGKLADAQKYLDQVKPYAEKAGLTSAINTAQQALTLAEQTGAANLKETASDLAKAKGEELKDKLDEKAENVKEKAAEKAEEAGAAVKNLFK